MIYLLRSGLSLYSIAKYPNGNNFVMNIMNFPRGCFTYERRAMKLCGHFCDNTQGESNCCNCDNPSITCNICKISRGSK